MTSITDAFLNTASIKKIDYSDIRVIESDRESITIKNGKVQTLFRGQDSGFGVRILHQGSWGFASSSQISEKEVERITLEALAIALAAQTAKKENVRLAPVEVFKDKYKTPYKKNPFDISIEEKLALFLNIDKLLRINPKLTNGTTSYDAWRQFKTFCSTEGSYIVQELLETGAGIEAVAFRDGEVQRRSFPNSFRGHFGTAGWEFIIDMDLPGNAERIGDEAVALLDAKPCPSEKTTLVLDGQQLALQIHESVGHPTEFDRVLGMEAAYAGGSFLTTKDLGTLRYGSPIVNIFADATLPKGLGTFGYDDEGVKAQRFDIVKEGYLQNFQTSRETAGLLNQKSNGTMRADGWNRYPLIRMTNISIQPGTHTPESLIGETKEGVYFETNKSWSIDDKRLNFQFGCEIGWEIKNGKKGDMLKNPNYTGITPEFWNNCDGICNDKYWVIWGTPNCGKGQPGQTAHVAHGASPGRFRNIQIGIRG